MNQKSVILWIIINYFKNVDEVLKITSKVKTLSTWPYVDREECGSVWMMVSLSSFLYTVNRCYSQRVKC